MSTINGTTVSTGVTLGSGYTSPLTITSSGAVEPSSGTVGIFGPNSQAWTIENHGTVTAPGTSSTGIDLRKGGYVNNAGLISAAYAAIRIAGGIGTVTNSGTLRSTGVIFTSGTRTGVIGEGITLASGGTIDNTGLILSANGIYFQSGNGTLTNAGTIIGTGYFDPHLDPGAAVYFKVATPGIVLNSGTIRQYADVVNFAVELQNGGTVINFSGGLIEAITGVKLNTYTYQGETHGNIATLVNAGVISGTAGTAGSYVPIAVDLGNGGYIDNQATGLLRAGMAVYVGHLTVAANQTPVNHGTVTNAGTIIGSVSYAIQFLIGGSVNNTGTISGAIDDIFIEGGSGTVTNSGTILGPGGTQNFGVYLTAGGTVSNQTGGLVKAITPVYVKGTTGAVTNTGTLLGGSGFGVDLAAGGSVDNQTGGLIQAKSAVKIGGSTGTLTNAGTLLGTSGTAVYLGAGGSVNNTAGLIKGAVGVDIKGTTGTLTNAGTILGTAGVGVDLAAGGTVVDSGTIDGSGGTAIVFGGAGSNRLVLQSGYKLTGGVAGSASATDTLELAGGVGAAITANSSTLGLSSFEDVLFGTGGYNTLKINNKSGTFGLTVSGFDQISEIIDLTGIGSNGIISHNDIVTNRLTITGSGGIVTLQLDASDGSSFTTVPDGSGGTVLSVACFCRGTLILTERGEVPVEVLEVGARLVTRDGSAKPLKWIGRRSYVGWLAAGNPKVLPVCFKPGSLADEVPRRELWVSPEHAMYLDGVLVPAALLVNGSSIVKAEAVEEVHYFHLELDAHDVIQAEGAWAESFVDDDSRGMFHNAAEYRARYPQAPLGAAVRYCVPRVEDGFDLEALRRRLAGRAWRLLADGTAPEAALAGNLEVVTHARIGGWVRDPAAPGTPVALVVLANGAEIGRVTADRYRGDLEAAGIGDGCHAFELAVPGGLATDLPHTIEICREDDGAPLPGSPYLLQRAVPAAAGEPERGAADAAAASMPPGVPLGRLRGNLEHAGHTGLGGWAQDCAAGERAVGLLVAVNGTTVGRVLANRYRADLEAAGIGRGRHGFELVLATPLPPFAGQEIRVMREADGAELPGSPLLLPAATRLDAGAERALAESLAGFAASDEARTLTLLTREADRLMARRAERQGGRAEREALLLFRRRWGAAAAARGATDGLRALVVDAQVPDAARDAGSSAILSHIRALQALGYAVSFAAAEAMHAEAALEGLAASAGITPCGRPFYSCVEDILSRQAGSFDLVYLHRAPIADRYLPLVRRYSPKARILYSVADLHHLRLARQAAIEQRPELLAYSRHLAALELSAARRADIVLTHSPVEAELLRRVVGPAAAGGSAAGGSAAGGSAARGRAKVHLVPFAVAARRPPRPFAARAGVAFIGNADHPPNGDAVHHLVRDILPLVWQADPAITCKIAGHGWQTSRMPQFDRRIEVVGAVKDLAAVFDAVRLTVAPLRFGAGIKGKVLDSFAAGLPCVLTGIAAEGLPHAGPLAHLIADNPEALAQLILHLHADEPANTRIGEAATRLIADEFCFERVTAALGAALSDWPSETTPRSLNAQSEQPSVA